MKLNVEKVVDNITWGKCIPTDSMKSGDNCSNLIHNTGTGKYVESKLIRHI